MTDTDSDTSKPANSPATPVSTVTPDSAKPPKLSAPSESSVGEGAGGALRFGDCELNFVSQTLTRKGKLIHLTGRGFSVLCHLAQHPQVLVSKDELLTAVWGRSVVSDSALTKRVQEVRKALGDDPSAPVYIETVPRRGYRFIAQISAARLPEAEVAALVGRDVEVDTILAHWAMAMAGAPQVLAICGEPGIGKSALVAHMRKRCSDAIWLSGQCVPQLDTPAPYLPLLDVLQGADTSASDTSVLERIAPNWMPLVRPAANVSEYRPMQSQLLREMSQVLDELNTARPVCVVLEDLQWADPSTLTWLGYFARRTASARVIVLVTCRDGAHGSIDANQVINELCDHNLVTRVDLSGLSRGDTTRLVAAGLPGITAIAAADLADTLWRKTDGHPLFVETLVRQLVAADVLGRQEGAWVLKRPLGQAPSLVPASVDRLIDQQLRQLSASRRQILQAASVLGRFLDSAALSQMTGFSQRHVDEECEQLASIAGLVTRERPLAYHFAHDVVREAVYQRIGSAARVHWHQLAAAYLGGVVPIPHSLVAAHYARAGDNNRAAPHFLLASHAARRASAHVESGRFARQGLAALEAGDLPDDAMRLALLIALGSALVATLGYTHPDVAAAFRAAGALHNVADQTQRFAILHGQRNYALMSGDLVASRAVESELVSLAKGSSDTTLTAWSEILGGESAFHRGELTAAADLLVKGRMRYPVSGTDPYFDTAWILPDVGALGYEALVRWELGAVDSAVALCDAAINRADAAGHALSSVFARYNMALVHIRRQDVASARPYINEFESIAIERGFALQIAWAEGMRGYCLLRDGDLDGAETLVNSTLESLRENASTLSLGSSIASLALLAMKRGDHDKAVTLIDQAVAHARDAGERVVQTTLQGLRGYMLFDDAPDDYIDEMERSFTATVRTARAIGAQSWEQRGCLGLALVHFAKRPDAKKFRAAQDALGEVHQRFSEGIELDEFQFVKGMLAASL